MSPSLNKVAHLISSRSSVSFGVTVCTDDVCGATMSLHPHRANRKLCLTSSGIAPATFTTLAQYYAH